MSASTLAHDHIISQPSPGQMRDRDAIIILYVIRLLCVPRETARAIYIYILYFPQKHRERKSRSRTRHVGNDFCFRQTCSRFLFTVHICIITPTLRARLTSNSSTTHVGVRFFNFHSRPDWTLSIISRRNFVRIICSAHSPLSFRYIFLPPIARNEIKWRVSI